MRPVNSKHVTYTGGTALDAFEGSHLLLFVTTGQTSGRPWTVALTFTTRARAAYRPSALLRSSLF